MYILFFIKYMSSKRIG